MRCTTLSRHLLRAALASILLAAFVVISADVSQAQSLFSCDDTSCDSMLACDCDSCDGRACAPTCCCLADCDKLFGDWLGIRPHLAEHGITTDAMLTQFYQTSFPVSQSRCSRL